LQCAKCQTEYEKEWRICPKCGTLLGHFLQTRKYKVLEKKMQGLNEENRLTADDFQIILNQEASLGWIFDKVILGELIGTRDLIFLVFYRDVLMGPSK